MYLIFISINSELKKHMYRWQNLIFYFYPTRIPSSISVGDTVSARSTTNFANCFTLIIYLASSLPSLIIFVQRATCNGCSPKGEKEILNLKKEMIYFEVLVYRQLNPIMQAVQDQYPIL